MNQQAKHITSLVLIRCPEAAKMLRKSDEITEHELEQLKAKLMAIQAPGAPLATRRTRPRGKNALHSDTSQEAALENREDKSRSLSRLIQ